MAKFETRLTGNFEEVVQRLEQGILHASLSATLEDATDFQATHSKCSVRVFERYSAIGKNRVSMNLTLFQEDGEDIQLSAITSGGSQAVFFKLNTMGEEAFLDTLKKLV